MRMLHGVTFTQAQADGRIEHDPENMSDRHVYLGMCGPRTVAFCERCGSNCGYYKQVKSRGIDLDAMHEKERQREDRRLLRDRRKHIWEGKG